MSVTEVIEILIAATVCICVVVLWKEFVKHIEF